MIEGAYGYRVDPAVLADGNRVGHEFAGRADALAAALGGVFAELAAAAGQNALSDALAGAGSATAQRMAQTVTMFAHIGDQLQSIAQSYQQADGAGSQQFGGIEGAL